MTSNSWSKLFAGAAALVVAAGVACSGGSAPTQSTTAASKGTSATAKAPAGQAAGDAARGKTLYTQTCVSCHGADAKGLPGLGKDLTNNTFIKSESDQQLVNFIKQGRPASDPANTTKIDMPPKGGNPALTDAQIADIVAYMRTLQ